MGDPLASAVRALSNGELVVYPTDTLIGLGARAFDRAAVERLLVAKDRPASLPLSLCVSSLEEIEPLVDWSVTARAVARDVLPGPVTLLLRPSPAARRDLPPAVISPGDTLGVRLPDHPVARELARRAGPITSTSANRHGAPTAFTLREARAALGDRVSVYLPARPPPSGRPSRLIDLSGPEPRVVPRK